MIFDPYSAQRLAEERLADLLREAEQERLARTVKRARKQRKQRLPIIMLMLTGLVNFIVRPQR